MPAEKSSSEVGARWPEVMLDIETMATSDDAVILEIGAVVFDREKRIVGEGFSMTLDYLDQPRRAVDMGTVAWWLDPKRIDRFREIQEGHEKKPGLWHGMGELSSFLETRLREGAEVWAKGDFDLRILRHAFEQLELEVPWKYYQARELRTVMKWVGLPNPENVPHSAVHDARLQVESLFQCERMLLRNLDFEKGWGVYRETLAETRAILLPDWKGLHDDVKESFAAGVLGATDEEWRWEAMPDGREEADETSACLE